MPSHDIRLDIVRNMARALPPIRRRFERKEREWQELNGGYDPDKDRAEYVKGVFAKHMEPAKAHLDLAGARVLEIGPGGNVGVALLFLTAGCRDAACIDTFPWVSEQTDLYRDLAEDADELLSKIDYRCPEAIETTPLPSESFDFVYSQAVLEHVRDPLATARSMARLLRPGGVTSHQVDLRDHRDFSDPLVFLQHSDWVWEAATSRSPSYMNRMRAPEWQMTFEKCGLKVLEMRVTESIAVTTAQMAGLNRRFRNVVTDPEPLGIHITAQKVAAPVV